MINLLETIITQFGCHPSRAKTMLEAAIGIIRAGSVQTLKIAAHMQNGSIKSRVERIRRFFAHQEIDPRCMALLIFQLLGIKRKKLDIILDRSNWKFGDNNINYLVLSIIVEGYGAVPLFWVPLEKRGNSNTNERIDLVNEFIEIFGEDRIGSLSGDREFIGNKWMKYLDNRNAPFFLRIKNNTQIKAQSSDFSVEIREILEDLKVGQRTKIPWVIGARTYYIAATRSKKGELVIVVTNKEKSPKKILNTYKKRWAIECMFKSLKSQGFNMEETHMTMLPRLMKLMSLCALACCLCLKVGLGLHRIRPIPIRKTVNALLYSYFSYGFNHIRSHFYEFIQEIYTPVKKFTLKGFFSLFMKSEG